ncbi:tripartite tricarboxylate transporter substrate binding protein [Ramlibacter sp. WS9]|uniref:Bug family tripartite tricarboxylate transporter substrate binding protein n=1 Tax=Ramlibacter sp. WS9 TaxID=1882741 RepID=UPI0011426A2A|nr:tripartite tricarboxylate transporter substrate binding protein [Ramlibacter sp. WS9]ROZ75041.1 tripartite tricarboxylate transporter substrate binding protein [Ramlibacter sp. WS9]
MTRPSTLLLAAIALSAGPLAFAADAFPSKPITIVTPFSAGSGPDAVLRLIADKLGKTWNQRVLIENKPGAGGFIAIDTARRAAPDGYTLLQLDSEHLGALPHLYKARGFEPLKTFEPVAALFRTPFLVAVPTDSKWKSMGDLVAGAKGLPGGVSFGSWGVGSPGHLGAEQLEVLTGVQMLHAPYREVSQLYTSVASGELAWAFATIPSSQGLYKAGKLRYLAVAAGKRIPQMPDVPTVAEAGGPAGLEVNSFAVLVAPRALPADVRAKINADVQKAMADPEVTSRFEAFAFEALSWSPQEIERQASLKSRTYAELVRRKNITLD